MACVAFGGNAATLPQRSVRLSKTGRPWAGKRAEQDVVSVRGPEADVGRESLGS